MHPSQVMDRADQPDSADKESLGAVVRRMIERKHPQSTERRESTRGPYYCTAMLRQGNRDSIATPAYVHDISDDGIGFIHGARIDLGETMAILHPNSNGRVTVRAQLVWCHAFGSGWYRSGGELVEVIDAATGKSSRH